MDIDVEELAKYPTESDDWVMTVIIGGILTFLFFLIIPAIAVAGYLVRAIRAGMADADEPPVFDDWGELLTEGLMAAIIGIIYQIIPFLVFAFFVGGAFLAFLTGSDAGAGVGLASLFGGFFLAWLLSIVFGYIGMAGIANYATVGEFGAGFDFDVIREVVTARSYLIAWVWVIAVNIVVGVITGVLNFIPFLGAIVGVFVTFYALIIAGWLWGRGFAEAREGASTTSTGVEEGGVAEA